MKAKITTALKAIKANLLHCFPLFQCGYENVRLLLNDIKAHDPTGQREYEDVRFNDILGNYFWIEKDKGGSITGTTKLDDCAITMLQMTQRFSLFSMVRGVDEALFFECLISCLAHNTCLSGGAKLSINGGEYDTIAVLMSVLKEEQIKTIGNIANFAISKIDFSINYVIKPVDYNGVDCECNACADC